MATQMQLKVLFGRKSHGRRDFYKEKTTIKSCLFMLTLSWTIEKELELNLYVMQAQFDNKPSLSGHTLKTSGPLACP